MHPRSADHLTPDQQAHLLLQVLEHIGNELEAGAVASVRPDRVRIRPLPVTQHKGTSSR